MNKLSKIFLFISLVFFAITISARFVLGGFSFFLYIPLFGALIALFASLILNFRMYIDIFSAKTAKKGLSFGWSLIVTLIFFTAISYLGKRFDYTWDLTEGKLHSLTKASLEALESLEEDLTIYIFYKGNKETLESKEIRNKIRERVASYKDKNSHVKLLFIDAYKEAEKADEFLKDLVDKKNTAVFAFVKYKDRKVRVNLPISEESLTSAIIKSGKKGTQTVLFLSGHQERVLDDEGPDGLKVLSQALNNSGIETKKWNFIEDGEPDSSVKLVAIVGPSQAFSPQELAWLKSYLKKGGNLLVALDPKTRHGLSPFLRDNGLQFNDDYILSLARNQQSPTTVLGVMFDLKHPITKSFAGKFVLFDQASSVDVIPSVFETSMASFLTRSHTHTIKTKELKGQIKVDKFNIHNMALEVGPKVEEEEDHDGHDDHEEDFTKPEHYMAQDTKKVGKKSRLVLFGDSDFLSNRYIYAGANQELALKSFTSLSGEEKPLSIPLKQPKGTQVTLSKTSKNVLVIIYIILPLIFFLSGLWLWFRKRSA